MNLADIEDIFNLNIKRCISNAGTLALAWTEPVNNIPFQPEFCIVRSITLNSDQNNTGEVYVVQSSLLNKPLVAIQPNDSLAPQTTIAMKKFFQSIEFSVSEISTTNTLITPAALAGTWFLSIDLDFIKLRKRTQYDPNKVIY